MKARLLVLLALTAACSSRGGSFDLVTDAATDRGGAVDTGAPPADTGTSPPDTGAPPTDAGTPPTDTGAPPVDAGPATTCGSDRDCSALDLVCDRAAGRCVECVVEADCPSGRACTPERSCVERVCTPGASECVSSARQSTCNAGGTMRVESACASGESCRVGRCQPLVCSPGSATCDEATGQRRVCNAEGTGATLVACPAGQRCRDGACAAMACVPNSRECATVSSLQVCDGTGSSVTVTPCTTGPNGTARCAAGACGFNCAPGFGHCDGVLSNGCETQLLTSREHCGACGNACPAGVSCVSGICGCAAGEVMCPAGCVRVQGDRTNCGACGVVCPSGQGCVLGVCQAGPSDNDVRLNGGILELYYMGSWRSVCDDSVAGVAQVACRQLGFRTGTASASQACISSGFWLDDVSCVGTEPHLGACTHLPYGTHNCGAVECIRLTCTN